MTTNLLFWRDFGPGRVRSRKGGKMRVVALAFLGGAILFLSGPSLPAYSCYRSPGDYGLPPVSACVGSWIQAGDIHDSWNVLQCFDRENRRIYTGSVPSSVSVNGLLHPSVLENAPCMKSYRPKGRKLFFLLTGSALSPVFTESVTNYGDIYAVPENFGGSR